MKGEPRLTEGYCDIIRVGLGFGLGLSVGPRKKDSPAPETAKMGLKTEIESVEFDAVADQALAAMKQCAEQLGITGVGMVAHYQTETNQGWSSKMRVVGRIKIPPAQNNSGINILAVAYSKASEMADTLEDSGSGVRAPMTGEFGWQGGLIKKGKKGYLIAAFSGDSAENDVKVSRAGLEVLSKGL